MPGTLLVAVNPQWQKIGTLDCVGDVDISTPIVNNFYYSSRWIETYSGAMPNSNAENKTDITPKKKETFSRVRTTLADCQEAESLVIRFES